MLVKILKGSRSKDILSRSLDLNPSYGFLRDYPTDEVLAHVDWVILNGYLTIEYSSRLPLLVFTERGWAIERQTHAEELLQELNKTLRFGLEAFDVLQLRDKHREVVSISLDKITATGNPRYIPVLAAWEVVAYKKVQKRIRQVIRELQYVPGSMGASPQPPSDSASDKPIPGE